VKGCSFDKLWCNRNCKDEILSKNDPIAARKKLCGVRIQNLLNLFFRYFESAVADLVRFILDTLKNKMLLVLVLRYVYKRTSCYMTLGNFFRLLSEATSIWETDLWEKLREGSFWEKLF
jgi:hypothetical protein